MIADEIKTHTEIYAGRSFLSADELLEHRKVIVKSFDDLDKENQAETIVYWLELIRDRRIKDHARDIEYELEVHNHKRMIDLKTYVFKLIATGVLVFFFGVILVASKDLWPLILSDIIKFL